MSWMRSGACRRNGGRSRSRSATARRTRCIPELGGGRCPPSEPPPRIGCAGEARARTRTTLRASPGRAETSSEGALLFQEDAVAGVYCYVRFVALAQMVGHRRPYHQLAVGPLHVVLREIALED